MIKKIFIVAIFIVLQLQHSFAQDGEYKNTQLKFYSAWRFIHFMDSLNNILPAEREKTVNRVWKQLALANRIPLVIDDTVLFLYKGKAEKVAWAGDFNGWDPNDSDSKGKLCGNTAIWFLQKSFPPDARLDYKIIVDKDWILDPANTYKQYSGFGPNSELRMPEYKYPESTITRPAINHGTLSDTHIIHSRKENLNYKIQYKVYLPYDYEMLSNLPVIYVTDGEEYSNSLQGSMIETLDNLIYDKKIQPIIAVFIDPCNPDSLYINRRMQEYRQSEGYLNFVCKELMPEINQSYHTSTDPDQTAILGASLGGWNSAWFGLEHPEIFHLLAIQSPAFPDEIIQTFSATARLPLKIFMSTGTIHDTQNQARKMRTVLESKHYPLKYMEVNEGHSWGNWRALIDDLLIYFFKPESNN